MLAIDKTAAQKAWSYAAVVLALWGLFIVRKTVLLFILAVMFSYLLYPLVEMIQVRLKIRARITAVALLFATILFLLVGTGGFLRGPVRGESANLMKQVKSDEFRKNLAQWHVLGIPVGEKITDGYSVGEIQSELLEAMPMVRSALGRAGRDLGNVFIIPILSFFMLKDGRQICDALIELFFNPNSGNEILKDKKIVESILQDAHTLILEYMRALVLLCFAVSIVFSIALKLMGVRYGLLMALLAFPLEFIPLIGPLVSGVLIIAVCEFNHYPHLSWIILFLLAYRLFQDYVLSPHLMNKSVKLHPLIIIFGVFAGGEIGNVGGIFLSVPLLALARLFFYEYRKRAMLYAAEKQRSVQPLPEELFDVGDVLGEAVGG